MSRSKLGSHFAWILQLILFKNYILIFLIPGTITIRPHILLLVRYIYIYLYIYIYIYLYIYKFYIYIPNPRIEPGSPALQVILYHLGHQGSHIYITATVWQIGRYLNLSPLTKDAPGPHFSEHGIPLETLSNRFWFSRSAVGPKILRSLP